MLNGTFHLVDVYVVAFATVTLNANRQVTGVLRGFDQFMNLVLDNTVDNKVKTDIGMVVSPLQAPSQCIFSDSAAVDVCLLLNVTHMKQHQIEGTMFPRRREQIQLIFLCSQNLPARYPVCTLCQQG